MQLGDAIRREFASSAEGDDVWICEYPLDGATSPWVVRSEQRGTLYGVMKPTTVKKTLPDFRRVAPYEKIAADLAFHLKLNVPPATLYRWPADRKCKKLKLIVKNVVVSLMPDGEPHNLKGETLPSVQKNRALRKAMENECGVVALDAWLGNDDRHQLDSLVYAPAEVRPFFFIDFSNSMDHNFYWSGTHARPLSAVNFPTLKIPEALEPRLKLEQINSTITAIENLEDELIREIVMRISDVFMEREERERSSGWLISRKKLLTREYSNWEPKYVPPDA